MNGKPFSGLPFNAILFLQIPQSRALLLTGRSETLRPTGEIHISIT